MILKAADRKAKLRRANFRRELQQRYNLVELGQATELHLTLAANASVVGDAAKTAACLDKAAAAAERVARAAKAPRAPKAPVRGAAPVGGHPGTSTLDTLLGRGIQ